MNCEKYPNVDLLECINGPVSLLDANRMATNERMDSNAVKQLVEHRNLIIKEIFPEIEIREVQTRAGIMLGYIGVSSETLQAAIKLKYEQEKVQKALRLGKQTLETGLSLKGFTTHGSEATLPDLQNCPHRKLSQSVEIS